MDIDLDELTILVARYRQVLDDGIRADTVIEYNELSMKLAQAVPTLLRAVKDVMKFRDELLAHEGSVATVTRSFGDEIDRALRGQR